MSHLLGYRDWHGTLQPTEDRPLKITRDPTGETAESICNHPGVRPWMVSTIDYHFNFRCLAHDPRWRMLIGSPPLGTFVCVRIFDGVWEAHAAVLPEGRGSWTLEFGEAAIRWMFTGTDAIEILTRVPQGHLGSLTLVRQLGFVQRWTRPSCRFRGRDVPYSVWSLTMFDAWPSEEGAQQAMFDDMRRAGQEQKATGWHNRHAFLSREPTI